MPVSAGNKYFIDGRYLSEEECRKSLNNGLLPLNDRQLKCLKMIEGGKIIDIGCYCGIFVNEAIKRFPGKDIIGLDYSEENIKIAHMLFPQYKGRIIKMNVCNLAMPDNSVDCITLQEVIEHLGEVGLALKEISRILKPGGILIVSTNNPYYWHDIIFFSLFELKNMFKIWVGRKPKLYSQVFFKDVEWNRHIYNWTMPTMLALLESNGFKYETHIYAYDRQNLFGRLIVKVFPFLGPTQIIKVRKEVK